MTINTWRDPYDAGFTTIRPKQIELNPGLTVLVGCNGAGKTTLLMNIKEECKKNKVPVHMYDNLRNGGSTNVFGALIAGCKEFDCDDMSLGVSLFTASEGEAIRININRQSSIYEQFFKTGVVKDRNPFIDIFRKEEEKEITTNVRVLLYDATDSGVSIDSICEIKEFFSSVLKYAEDNNIELYIIISANEYELCRGEQCFDVNAGKYLAFKDYEDYRAFILKSRERKKKRILKQMEWIEKQKKKEQQMFERLRKANLAKIEKIKAKAVDENRELSIHEKWDIEYLERGIKDFKRHCRFWAEEE